MKYEKSRRLKALFKKHKNIRGQIATELIDTINFITSNIFVLFQSVKTLKSQTNIIYMLEKMQEFGKESFLSTYTEIINCGVRTGKPDIPERIIKAFVNLYCFISKEPDFFAETFTDVFTEMDPAQRERFMGASAAILRQHLQDLKTEIEQEQSTLITSTTAALFNHPKESIESSPAKLSTGGEKPALALTP